MDMYIHTILATGCLAGAYYIGRYVSGKNILEQIVTHTLDRLEREGFIVTECDEDGDKELILVSELIANAVEESKKTT